MTNTKHSCCVEQEKQRSENKLLWNAEHETTDCRKPAMVTNQLSPVCTKKPRYSGQSVAVNPERFMSQFPQKYVVIDAVKCGAEVEQTEQRYAPMVGS